MSYYEDIRSFVHTLGDTAILSIVAYPKSGIGAKLVNTPYRKKYENKLLDLHKRLKDEYYQLLHEEEGKIPHERISDLFDKYIDKFKDVQERYGRKAEEIRKLKEQKDQKRLEEVV